MTIADELPNSMLATKEANRSDALQASMQAQPVDNPDIMVMEKIQDKTIYNLPYPGILPDHALYPFKLFRDKLLNLFIQDPQRKIEFNLLMADKRLNMGVFLIEKGKYELAAKTVGEAQGFINNGIDIINDLQKEDKNLVSKSIIDTYQKSADKQQEVLIIMKINAPENLQKGYEELIQIAEEISQRILEM